MHRDALTRKVRRPVSGGVRGRPGCEAHGGPRSLDEVRGQAAPGLGAWRAVELALRSRRAGAGGRVRGGAGPCGRCPGHDVAGRPAGRWFQPWRAAGARPSLWAMADCAGRGGPATELRGHGRPFHGRDVHALLPRAGRAARGHGSGEQCPACRLAPELCPVGRGPSGRRSGRGGRMPSDRTRTTRLCACSLSPPRSGTSPLRGWPPVVPCWTASPTATTRLPGPMLTSMPRTGPSGSRTAAFRRSS